MTAILGTNVAAPVVPFDSDDTYATHDAQYGKGGYRSVATIALRDAIPTQRRTDGMRVRVTADPVSTNNVDWDWIGGNWVTTPLSTQIVDAVNTTTTNANTSTTQAGLATAARFAAEAARDSSFANAKGAATIADARALVAINETFIVYVDGAVTFQAYRKTGTSTEVFLGEYPSASAAMLTSGNIFASTTTDITLAKGATSISVSGRVVGFTIPADSSGGGSYVGANITASALRGKTIRLIQRYSATESFLINVNLNNNFVQSVVGNVATVITPTTTSRVQTGTEIVQISQVVVPANCDVIRQILQVVSTNPVEASAQSIQIVGVAYQVLSDANATQTIADTVLDQRLEWINPAIAASVAPVTASVTALSARVDQNALTSGNLLGTATGGQALCEAYNGATTTSSGGVFVGFSIPASAGTANTWTGTNTYITRFIDARGLVGKTVDFVANYTTSANFAALTPASTIAIQARINGVLVTVNTSSVTRTIAQNGTSMTVTVRYTVPAGTTDVGVVYQVASSSTTQSTDRTISIVSALYQLAPPAGKTTNDVMADQRISDALAVALDGVAYSTAVIQAGPTRTYTTPKAANDAVTAATKNARTEIQLDSGTYAADPEGWTLAHYATLKGYGPTMPVIHYAGADGADHSTLETLWIRRDAVIDGVKITGRNVRYPVHAESGSIAAGATQDCKVFVRNSWIEHLGNANNNWSSQAAWGSGISSGWHVRSENTTYKAPFCAFSYHTNDGFTKPTLVENIGDTLIGTEGDTTTSGMALRIQPLGSGQNDQYRAIGCEFVGGIFYYPDPWMPTTLAYQPANHCEIQMSGYDNTPTVFRVNDFGLALRIRAIAGAGSSIAVSGDAVPVIFGTVRTFPGVENLPAYVDGTFDVSGVGVGISKNVFITSLGKRLGNCTSVNKTLTVVVNGGAPVNVVFNQDYTNTDNATIIAAIQSAIGSTSVVVVDTYSPGNNFHPAFTDEEKSLQNSSSTAGIPKGSILAYDGTRKRVKLMTSSDAASLFAGVALEDIYPATFGRVKTRGWLWLSYIRSSANTLTFGATMSVGTTPGKVDADGSQGLLRAVRTDAVEVAP